MKSNQYIEHVFDANASGNSLDVANVYGSLHMSGGSDAGRLRDLRDCKVVKLQLCKADGSCQHEFVLATIHHPQNEEFPRVLRLERSSHPTSVSNSSNASSANQPKPDANPAVDTVQYFAEEKTALQWKAKRACVCWTITFLEGDDPNFIELISAAKVLNEAAPGRSLATRMCCWFSYSLVAVLTYNRKHLVNTTNPVNTPFPGHFSVVPILNTTGNGKKQRKNKLVEDTVPNDTKGKSKTFMALFQGRSGRSTPTQLEADVSDASEDVVEYHGHFLAAVVEVERLITVHDAQRSALNAAVVRGDMMERERDVAFEQRDTALAQRDAALESAAALERELEAIRLQTKALES